VEEVLILGTGLKANRKNATKQVMGNKREH